MISARVMVLLLLLVAVITALSVVRARHGSRVLFVELQQLESHRDALDVEWGQLQLEQSAWATHGRIEQLARRELKMVMPRNSRIVVSDDAE